MVIWCWLFASRDLPLRRSCGLPMPSEISRDLPWPLSIGMPLPPSRCLYPVASSVPWRTAGDGRWACTKIVPKKCQHSAKLLFAHSLHEVASFLVHGEFAQHSNNNVRSYNRGVFCIKLVLPMYQVISVASSALSCANLVCAKVVSTLSVGTNVAPCWHTLSLLVTSCKMQKP